MLYYSNWAFFKKYWQGYSGKHGPRVTHGSLANDPSQKTISESHTSSSRSVKKLTKYITQLRLSLFCMKKTSTWNKPWWTSPLEVRIKMVLQNVQAAKGCEYQRTPSCRRRAEQKPGKVSDRLSPCVVVVLSYLVPGARLEKVKILHTYLSFVYNPHNSPKKEVLFSCPVCSRWNGDSREAQQPTSFRTY